eukprot:1994046-Alexandrium_andersonii.AAC.1
MSLMSSVRQTWSACRVELSGLALPTARLAMLPRGVGTAPHAGVRGGPASVLPVAVGVIIAVTGWAAQTLA